MTTNLNTTITAIPKTYPKYPFCIINLRYRDYTEYCEGDDFAVKLFTKESNRFVGELIGMGKLQEFFRTVILTGRLKGVAPVSAMLIADPERGKTSIVVEKNSEAFKVLTDITGMGLRHLCAVDSRCTHFIINDMGILSGHSNKTQAYFYGMLIAMTEEGIRAMAGPEGLETITGGRRAFIGCITSSQARDKRMWWKQRGLERRLVPFHFDYTEDLILKIKAQVDKGNSSDFNGNGVFPIPDANIAVDIPDEQTKEIRRIADPKADKMGQLGISLLKNYRALAMGHALFRNWKKPVVNASDVEFLKRIDPYVDWTTPGVL